MLFKIVYLSNLKYFFFRFYSSSEYIQICVQYIQVKIRIRLVKLTVKSTLLTLEFL